MNVTQVRDEAQFRQALARLVARPGLSPADQRGQVDVLAKYAEKRAISLEHCLIATDGGEMVASCLCADAPGRAASLFLPVTIEETADTRTLIALLDETASRARQRNVQLLQALIPPDARIDTEVYKAAGFDLLARLLYLESDLDKLIFAHKSLPELDFATYGRATHDLFADVIRQTYEESLDCGSLNGIRDIEDILASHRATGLFDPQSWRVALRDEEPVGVLLLSYIPEGPSHEVVYMGLLPAFRHLGYGSALLAHGVELAREQAARLLTLAVDERNTPARKLYERFGFVETTRRDAWIRILSKPNSVPDSCDAASP